MEQKLKKQRRKILIKITLILTAVWLAVSAVYCVITLISVKNDQQTRLLEEFTAATQKYTEGGTNNDIINHLMFGHTSSQAADSEPDRDWNGHIMLLAPLKKQIIDSTKCIMIDTGVKLPGGGYYEYFGFLNHDSLMDSLSENQITEITELLRSTPEKKGSYQLVCKDFYIRSAELIPVTLEVVLVEEGSIWYAEDEVIGSYSTTAGPLAGETLFHGDDMHRNIIPKEFFIGGAYNNSYIDSLSNEQKEHTADMFFTSPFDGIFYSYDYITFQDFAFKNEQELNEYSQKTYLIRYATKVDLLKICGKQLALGTLLFFGFFFIIGLVLCIMIWKMISSQMMQEQKRTELTNALAHDIKTPLFVISGNAYILKEKIDEDKRDEYVDKIIEQADQINDLVHRMLNLSKLDSYDLTISKTDIRLRAFTEEILKNYSQLPDKKSIVLSESEDFTVSGDKDLLKTALQNLIDNSVKYSPENSEITISVSDRKFTVSNKSEPLSKADLKQIWQPFIRKDKSRHKKGNGLGLSIIRSIAELHGAKSEAYFKDGIFTIVLDFGRQP